jgi:hypothetical protein
MQQPKFLKIIGIVFAVILFLALDVLIIQNFGKVAIFLEDAGIETNTNELVFLSEADKQKIFTEIDVAKTPAELDTKLMFALTEVLDGYNAKRRPGDPFLIAPEFLSDNPTGILVNTAGIQVDLLEGLKIAPLQDADMPLLRSFSKLFIEEYSRYPLAWMPHITPPVISFVKSVGLWNGEMVGGVQQGVVVYDISNLEDRHYSKRLIHHELMHWAEKSSGTRENSATQAVFGNYTLKYNLGAAYNFKEYPKPGFVTGYAETNSAEDKAELYASLFTAEGQKKLPEWTKEDVVLRKKVEYLKHFMQQRVQKMDDSYFTAKVSSN